MRENDFALRDYEIYVPDSHKYIIQLRWVKQRIAAQEEISISSFRNQRKMTILVINTSLHLLALVDAFDISTAAITLKSVVKSMSKSKSFRKS